MNLQALYDKALDKSTTSGERMNCRRMFVKIVLKKKCKTGNEARHAFSKAVSVWRSQQ